MDRVIYEHYNYYKKFDPNRSFPFKNWPKSNKVLGGLWGCRVGATYGWPLISKMIEKNENRLIDELYEKGELDEKIYINHTPTEECERFEFVLKPWANNYIIHTMQDYNKLPKLTELTSEGKEAIDFEQCLKDGIDAVEFCAIGDEYEEYNTQEEFDVLDETIGWAWGCDSIVVLNKDAYEII